MQVGLLLPNSNYIHRLASDVRRCISDGLNDGDLTAHDIAVETTSFNASPNEVADKVQQLVIKDDVDVVVAPLNAALVETIGPVMRGQQTPLIMLTMGEDIFAGDLAPPWVFCNSFNLWRSAWLTGRWAARNHGGAACVVAAAHDGGYGLNLAFALGVEAAGGQLAATIPTTMQLDASGAAAAIAAANEVEADFVMLMASGADLELLIDAHSAVAPTVPLVGLPPFAYRLVDDRIVAAGSAVHSISVWDAGSPGSRTFIERSIAASGRPANSYGALAYEAGLLLAAASRGAGDHPLQGESLCAALASASADGPRGRVAFDVDGQEVVTAQHLLTAIAREGETDVAAAAIESPDLLDEQIVLARKNIDKTGWTNPYLIA